MGDISWWSSPRLRSPVEMYDCQNDPCELNNVFEDANLESVRPRFDRGHI